MTPNLILEQTAAFVREKMSRDSSGHDWWHVDRVRRLALLIAQAEGADPVICELAALLHDLDDWKLAGVEDIAAAPQVARNWLQSCAVPAEFAQTVCEIIAGVSFQGAGLITDMPTLEGRCVQDADRLDALGAIGIARAFACGGAWGRPLYDPAAEPQFHADFAAYRSNSQTTINHFHEKLLLLRERMQTVTGRRLAESRHRYMEEFLARFHAEWNLDAENDENRHF